ncbi:MAG: hypothetical protein JSS66_12220 [Armatimonadetes bacterium]|nr:hypothetical protein [Armatimonadota bacterium]
METRRKPKLLAAAIVLVASFAWVSVLYQGVTARAQSDAVWRKAHANAKVIAPAGKCGCEK